MFNIFLSLIKTQLFDQLSAIIDKVTAADVDSLKLALKVEIAKLLRIQFVKPS